MKYERDVLFALSWIIARERRDNLRVKLRLQVYLKVTTISWYRIIYLSFPFIHSVKPKEEMVRIEGVYNILYIWGCNKTDIKEIEEEV